MAAEKINYSEALFRIHHSLFEGVDNTLRITSKSISGEYLKQCDAHSVVDFCLNCVYFHPYCKLAFIFFILGFFINETIIF